MHNRIIGWSGEAFEPHTHPQPMYIYITATICSNWCGPAQIIFPAKAFVLSQKTVSTFCSCLTNLRLFAVCYSAAGPVPVHPHQCQPQAAAPAFRAVQPKRTFIAQITACRKVNLIDCAIDYVMLGRAAVIEHLFCNCDQFANVL